jgi:lipoprotein NlpD
MRAARTALRGALAIALALLAACGTHTYHIVQRGDSLYTIGWAYGYDYRDLAQWNGLQPPYTLTAGQRVSLVPPSGDKTAKPKTIAKPPVATPAPKAEGARASANVPATKERDANVIAWTWPADGTVIEKFDDDDPLKKGINITGALGQPVRAAAAGRVVYSGSGLVGYGKLIIVKHNDQMLSAYAHNKELLVVEGDVVEAGSQIAEMGSSGANVVMLHFEIRRDGQPVDPLRYLPGRPQ